MGSWLGTCAISHLPIRYEDDVRLVVLRQRKTFGDDWVGGGGGGLVYESDIWVPLGIPFRAQYYLYGDVQYIEGSLGTEWLVKFFNEEHQKNNLVISQRSRENWKHRCVNFGTKVDKDKLSLEQILYHIERSSIWCKRNIHGKEMLPYGYVLMLESVYQAALKIFAEDEGYSKWATQREEEIDKVLKQYFEAKDLPNDHPDKMHLMLSADLHDTFRFGEREHNPILHEARLAYPYEQAKQIIGQAWELAKISTLMNDLRRAWMPQCGKGSQTEDYETHRKFAQAVDAICLQEISRVYD